MKTRTEIACEVRDELYALEASLDAQVEQAKAYVTRLELAKREAGVTGSVGDAAIARAKDVVASLETAREQLTESHDEAHAVLKALRIPNVAIQDKVLLQQERRAG